MSTKPRYVIDVSGIPEIANSQAMSDAMVEAATRAIPAVRRAAPRDTGRLAESFRVTPTKVTAGRRGDVRAGAAIVAEVPYAVYVRKDGRRFMASIPAIVRGVNSS